MVVMGFGVGDRKWVHTTLSLRERLTGTQCISAPPDSQTPVSPLSGRLASVWTFATWEGLPIS